MYDATHFSWRLFVSQLAAVLLLMCAIFGVALSSTQPSVASPALGAFIGSAVLPASFMTFAVSSYWQQQRRGDAFLFGVLGTVMICVAIIERGL